jgi:hypothetical protein
MDEDYFGHLSRNLLTAFCQTEGYGDHQHDCVRVNTFLAGQRWTLAEGQIMQGLTNKYLRPLSRQILGQIQALFLRCLC